MFLYWATYARRRRWDYARLDRWNLDDGMYLGYTDRYRVCIDHPRVVSEELYSVRYKGNSSYDSWGQILEFRFFNPAPSTAPTMSPSTAPTMSPSTAQTTPPYHPHPAANEYFVPSAWKTDIYQHYNLNTPVSPPRIRLVNMEKLRTDLNPNNYTFNLTSIKEKHYRLPNYLTQDVKEKNPVTLYIRDNWVSHHNIDDLYAYTASVSESYPILVPVAFVLGLYIIFKSL
jgi:hypothetical protein